MCAQCRRRLRPCCPRCRRRAPVRGLQSASCKRLTQGEGKSSETETPRLQETEGLARGARPRKGESRVTSRPVPGPQSTHSTGLRSPHRSPACGPHLGAPRHVPLHPRLHKYGAASGDTVPGRGARAVGLEDRWSDFIPSCPGRNAWGSRRSPSLKR